MDSLFLILIIAVPILSVLGWIFWIVVVAVIAKKAMKSGAGAGQFGPGYGDLDALLIELEQSIRAASGPYGAQGPRAGTTNLPPQQALAIQAMFMQAQNHMAQMDTLSQQRYETKMADLSGMAASAGIDWTPGSY